MPDIWGITAIAVKFALYLGILTSAGTVFAALLFQLQRYRGLAIGFAIIGLVATILSFSVRGAMLTGDASGMLDGEMLSLLWATPVGSALSYRLIGLGVLMAGIMLGRRGLWLSAVGGVLAIWSFDHVGHVPDRDTTMLDIALTLHLLSVSLWIGILTPLRRMAGCNIARAAAIGHRFGMIASVTVPVLIFVGVYMSYVLVGGFGALIATGYGQALLIKIGLVGGLLALAAVNKLRFVPRLQAGDRPAAHHLSQSITVEWFLIVLILGITAVLTSTLTLPT